MSLSFKEHVDRYHTRMEELRGIVDRNGTLKAQSDRYPHYRIVLTRSTSPGVVWQVTSFDGREPTGHRDYDRLDGGSPMQNALAEFMSADMRIL